MEIPALKLKQYDRNKKRFTQELGEALEAVGVAQVSGLEQGLVDDLYGYMQRHVDEIQPDQDDYAVKREYRQLFRINNSGLRKALYLNKLITSIKKNISKIRDKVYSTAATLYGPLNKSQDLLLFRYYKKQGRALQQNTAMIRKHTDDQSPLTFAPSASAPGLEGKINGRWTRLQPQRGYLLVWPGDDLESISESGVKALLHRVQYPTTERWALIYG